MRTTWKTIRNETKRGDSIELSRFFLGVFLCSLSIVRHNERNLFGEIK